jgi:hypothetical protein
VLGRQTLVPFTLFLPVPQQASAAGATAAQIAFLYPASKLTDYRDLGALRAALEHLPGAAPQGEPLNVVLVGELEDIGAAMVRRNYHRDARAADMDQQVFGRRPDVVLRKQAQTRVPSTWIRVWRAPVTFEGRAVYVGQVARPVGGRFAPADATDLRGARGCGRGTESPRPGHDVFGGPGQARVCARRCGGRAQRWPARGAVLCDAAAQPR